MKGSILLLVTASCLVVGGGCVQANSLVQSSAKDKITNLPGLKEQVKFDQYSGYLQADDEGKQFLHYWLVESERNPEVAPILVWISGTPGCSSLNGLFNEIGPFKVNQTGDVLKPNDYSWNKFASILFLETPSETGFSYSNLSSNHYTDDSVAQSNYRALKSFIKKFPKFQKNPLYLTGESYAGVYLPTLGLLIDTDKQFNFKGMAIGNGFFDDEKTFESRVFFSYYHGLGGKTSWKKLSKECCSSHEPSIENCKLSGDDLSEECIRAIGGVSQSIYFGYINPYNIYADCAKQEFRLDPPCTNSKSLYTYLNKREVKAAIHIPQEVSQDWNLCNDIDYTMVYPLVSGGLRAQVTKLIKSKRNLSILFYNGDVDATCDFLGVEWFVDGLERKVIDDHSPWAVNKRVAGFIKHYDGISLATVLGAGLHVPADKPQQAFELMKTFLKL